MDYLVTVHGLFPFKESETTVKPGDQKVQVKQQVGDCNPTVRSQKADNVICEVP
jgi:hypothetical protein